MKTDNSSVGAEANEVSLTGRPREYYQKRAIAKRKELGVEKLWSKSFCKKNGLWSFVFDEKTGFANECEIENCLQEYAVIILKEFDDKELVYWIQYTIGELL